MTLFEVDPSLVKPGWTPLLILVILMVAMVLLYLSMRRQFRRIDVTQSQPQLQSQPQNLPAAQAQAAKDDPAD